MLPTLDSAFYRRLAVTAAALAVFRLGSVIPMPGISPEVVGNLVARRRQPLSRVSLLALGINPLLNALILTELLKIAAPSVRAWEFAAPANRSRMRNIVYGLALLFAILQAAGCRARLEGVAGVVPEPGAAFRIVSIVTMVAGTALVIGLAAVIDRAGLGSGLWLIFLTPTLAELPQNLATIAQLYDMGQYSLRRHPARRGVHRHRRRRHRRHRARRTRRRGNLWPPACGRPCSATRCWPGC